MERSERKQTPWNDANGKLLSDQDLRNVSADWDAETWELFLESTVDREMSRNETVMDDYEVNLDEEVAEAIWTADCSVPEPVHRRIHNAIRRLTKQQRTVVRSIYFLGHTHHIISKKMKIRRATVTQTNTISLNKIKSFLNFDPTTVAYLIGGSAILPAKQQTREQDLLEVYRADLNGSYMK